MTARSPHKRSKKPLIGRRSVRDVSEMDARYAPVKNVKQWKTKLVEALGGEAAITPQKSLLVDAAARSALFIADVDAYLLETGVVNRRRRSTVPALAQRETLVTNMLRLLTALGLERVEADPLAELRRELIGGRADEPDDADLPPLPAEEDQPAELLSDAIPEEHR
jgi:hypothetical protein